MPGRMRQRTINKERKQADEKHVGCEFDPFCEGAGNQRRSNDGEFQLVNGEQNQGNRWCQFSGRSLQSVIHHKKGLRISDDSSNRVAKGKTESDDNPKNGDHTHADKTLQHG